MDLNKLKIACEKWNVNIFLELNNIDLNNTDPIELIKKINNLEEEQRKIVLTDKRIQDYLKNILLDKYVYGGYTFYNNLFSLIDFKDIKDIFDKEFLNSFFTSPNDYQLLSSIFINSKNHNEIINIIIEDENFFEVLKKEYDKFYSGIELDEKTTLKLIRKIEKTNSFQEFTMLRFNIKQSEYLLQESYSYEVLMWLLDRMPTKIKTNFFAKDPRAENIIPYLKDKIRRYAETGVIFENKIIKNPQFFEMLKCESLIYFRQRINSIEENCNIPDFIEEKRKQYYDNLINSYQEESRLFKIYEELIKNPDLLNNKKKLDPYLFNVYTTNREELIKETNQKLSELIVDGLFQDNIYNVWININELLKYDSYLSTNEKIISKENLKLYKLILEIDKCPPKEKIDLYNRLKDKNINLLFYEDIRKSKDLAYQKIKNQMIIPNNHPEYKNSEETKKYGVEIYDLRDKTYYMLIRKFSTPYEENMSRRSGSSYSLISNNNTDVFDNGGIIYGYNTFDNDRVEHMFESDSHSYTFTSKRNKTSNVTDRPNRISTAKELADSPNYSEIILKNQSTDSKNRYHEIKPDFIVVIDKIDERSIKESKRLNIPIVIIKKQLYKNSTNFSIDRTKNYTTRDVMEEIRKSKR